MYNVYVVQQLTIKGAKMNLGTDTINETTEDIKTDVEIVSEQKEHEVVTALKVKADPVDISPEDRKRNVKKLAGAISHSLRNSGEISVRCFGSASIAKGVKALAIATNNINVQNLHAIATNNINVQNLQLSCAPAFIEAKMGDSNLTGIGFYTFVSEKTIKVDIDKCKSVLFVKSDPKDVAADTRKDNLHKLAGAIAHSLAENKEVVLRCFGSATIGKASKALAVARGHVANKGGDLYCFPVFIMADMNGADRTGIAFYAFTNEMM